MRFDFISLLYLLGVGFIFSPTPLLASLRDEYTINEVNDCSITNLDKYNYSLFANFNNRANSEKLRVPKRYRPYFGSFYCVPDETKEIWKFREKIFQKR